MSPDIRLSSPYFMLILFMLVLLAGLTVTILGDSYIRREQKKIILFILALVLSLIVQNFLENRLATGDPHPFLRTLASIYGYCVRPVPLVLLHYIILNGQKNRAAWILTGINAAAYLTALFCPVAFRITEENEFSPGPLRFTCHVVTAVLLANLLRVTITEYGKTGWEAAVLPVFNTIVIVIGAVLDWSSGNYPVTWLNTAIVISCIFYYIWLHQQFVREHEQDLKAQQRIRIMMSQIQPHFLFNTIATIRVLCKKDPDGAADIAGKFGQYLRQNLDSLGEEGLIPLEKELEHTKVYAEIEKVRFENIRVEYEILDEGFSIPPLTIQPLVENAIRHGVRIRDDGLVRVATCRRGDFHEILVEDNGKGFEPEQIGSMDGTHIGIRNVRERIEKMCGGTLLIESCPGEGTKILIRIPAEQERPVQQDC